MATGKSGSFTIAGTKNMSAVCYWSETYDANANTHYVSITGVSLISTNWYGFMYYPNGTLSIGGVTCCTFNSAIPTHQCLVSAQNTEYFISGVNGYYVENSHEAIIQPDEWDAVQLEVARRKAMGRQYSGSSIFGAKLVCGDCGSFYGSKVWNSTSKYRRTIWQCNNKFKGEKRCTTPHLDEETIKQRFVKAFNGLFSMKDELIASASRVKALFTDCSALDAEALWLQREMEEIANLTQQCIEENARTVQDQAEFTARYNAYVERFETAKAALEKVEQDRQLRLSRADAFDGFIRTLTSIDGSLQEFDDKVWLTTLEKATVYHDGRLVFRFNDGSEIEA